MIIYQLTAAENRCWAFDQSTANLGAGQGFCAGMVIVWIFLRADDRDFAVTMGKIGDYTFPTIDLEAEELEKVRSYQASCVKVIGRQGYRSVLNAERYEVEKAILAGPDMSVDDRSLADHVSRSAHQAPTRAQRKDGSRTWFLLRLRPARTKAEGDSGHVVAIEVDCHKNEEMFRLMDPSNGQFQFATKNSFQDWLTTVFFAKSGYLQLYPYMKIHKVSRITTTGVSAFAMQIKSLFSTG